MRGICLGLTCAILLAAVPRAAAQTTSQDRERARPIYRAAWEHMRAEAWPEAARAFQQAIDIDPSFEDAHYGLGRASMGMKKYSDAVKAYLRCRELYQAQAGRQFSNQHEAQRYRQDRLTELDEVIRQYQTGPQTVQAQERLRQLQEQRRQLQDRLSRGVNMTIAQAVPPFVSLALGSAYFRSERFAEAEREYKAAIAGDPRSGEAYSNLAVVYLYSERYAEAENAVKAAEKTGFKVNPGLKEDIRKRKAGGAPS